jgi:hypothetical protein
MDFLTSSPYIYIAGVSLLILAAVAYFGYLKYTEMTQKEERLENNLRKVIDAVNDITDRLNDTTPEEAEHDCGEHADDPAPEEVLVSRLPAIKELTEEDSSSESSFDDVDNFDDDDSHDTAAEPVVIQLGRNSTCTYILENGKRKGSPCLKPSPKRTGYCPSHQDKVPVPLD